MMMTMMTFSGLWPFAWNKRIDYWWSITQKYAGARILCGGIV